MDSVKKFLQTPAIVIEANESAAVGAKLMAREKTKALIVRENGDCVGLVTASDFVSKVIANASNGTDIQIGSIANRPLITIGGEASMNEALSLMLEHDIRSLVAIENDRPCGLLHGNDIASYYFQDFLKNSNPIARFWAQYSCHEGKNTFNQLVDQLLHEMEDHLGPFSATARRIRNKAPWSDIAEEAEEEELYELAQILNLAKIE
ncbi:MAG: CBS domain-containing protein [Candidatus Nitrohelix vancouverensis]|uniref:CBS domain-containing protein n=1 Tax=Candidatus Nitrohelix vancouverensis TaxID=2705534 RepID=A0A7T0G439_9BACT|nr:MAG: CBS domain-containing protein [Candidatus Nitrohelix vancouverensis]